MTPLAKRFNDALLSISAANAQYGMVIRGFVKHLTNNPMSDDEIRGGLEWVKAMVDGVLYDPDVPIVEPERGANLPPEFVPTFEDEQSVTV